MWRSTEKIAGWKENYMADYYNFQKLDPLNKPEDKKIVEEYWRTVADGETVDGLKIQDAKYFK